MKFQKTSRNWLALALSLGLSATAFTAHAHEGPAPSSSGPDTSQPNGGTAQGMQHHYSHKNGYQGHHGNSAHSRHHGMHNQGGMHHGQLEEIAGIEKELRSDLQELKVQRYEESLKLQELYAEDELDAGDINDQQQKVFDVIKEITELQVEAQQDIRDLLTSEQRTQLQRSGGWLMLN